MRRFPSIVVLGALVVHAAVHAQTLPVPDFRQRLIDQSNTLSRDEIRALETKLEEFERATSNQVVVLMIPSLGGESIEEYSLRVAEKNKFGKRERNNGILLVIAKNDRKLRIEVGYGLEGALPDATADQIIRHVIVPRLRNGDYFGGISAGLDAIMAATRGEYKGEGDDMMQGPVLAAIVVLAVIVMLLIISFRSRKHYIGRRGYSSGGGWWWGGGGSGGGGSGGGGFSGGGGGFGGGGASGSW